MGARDPLTPVPGREAAVAREYEFLDTDFARVREMIYRCAGIHLSGNKQHMVYSRLARRLRQTGMRSFREYLDRIESDAAFQSAEAQEFVNALTTNLTSFFREAHHFAALGRFLSNLGSAPRIWCAASSTGEEAYCIAMTMVEAARGRPPGNVLASDIDTHVLATAARGAYRLESAKACGEERLRRFFLRGRGDNAGMVRVRPELAALVRFEQVNLLDEQWPRVRDFGASLDAVFCRNVMIYFDRKTQRRIFARLAEVLRPGGLLFVGHSENFNDCNEALVLRGQTIYERK
jgi:chemotaxis protein methyltransferase CheR